MELYKTKRLNFPEPQLAMSDGLVAINDELSVELLVEAYSFGIFPWPHEDSPILWFSPDPRGVLEFKNLHIPKSLRKFIKKCNWEVTFNKAFDQVIDNCAFKVRKGEVGTWITDHMRNCYKKFHLSNYAHSLEIWEGTELIGGMYGVYIGGSFSGESMFFNKNEASKLALLSLVKVLKENNIEWLDIQMVTPNLKVFGSKYISRENYYKKLNLAKNRAKPLKLPEQKLNIRDLLKSLTPG